MRRLSLVMLCALIALLFSVGLSEHKAEAQTGYASWYSMPGAYTASGQVMTASTWGTAHRTLPFGTELTVCYAGRCAYNVPGIDRPTLFRVGAPPRRGGHRMACGRGYRERRFVAASEDSAKLAIEHHKDGGGRASAHTLNGLSLP